MTHTITRTFTEHPILFKAEMVRAIFDGRKTQTRRIVKPQPERPLIANAAGDFRYTDHEGIAANSPTFKCPYGHVGDRLWVREAWLFNKEEADHGYHYKADGPTALWAHFNGLKWKPSIHMPRVASRLMLEITDIRVEKIQSISYEDCIAEGVKDGMGQAADWLYRQLWKKINGEAAWNSNPWVWAISFKKV